MNPPLLPVFSYTAVYAKTHASMQKASRVLFFHAVIVNQTSFQDDLALFIGQLTEGYGKRLQAVCIYHISCNFCSLFPLPPCGCRGRRGNHESVNGRSPVRNDERKHAPVDQIGTIPFGRIFICNICPTAQHLLSGSLQPALSQNHLRALLRKSWNRTRCCRLQPAGTAHGFHP